MRPNLPNGLLKERYLRDEKYITVYDQFTPNYNHRSITPKFYSKHEGQIPKPDPAFLKGVIEKYKSPKEKLKWPETTNQWYGWFIPSFTDDIRFDSRLYFPMRTSEMIKHLLRLNRDKTRQRK